MSEHLKVSDLKSHFFTRDGVLKAVDGISFAINQGETLALVGESGCGKSMTALSLLRLLPAPGKIISGSIELDGRELLSLPEAEMRKIRGNDISMIFQEPMTSLNPVLRIGDQISEVLRLHRGATKKSALDMAAELLNQVGLSDPDKRLRDYPHLLSGGQRQRIMIAMALACDPKLLIADEPTTALDVTIQAQIMDLLLEMKQQRNMTMLLISHDLGVVAGNADRIAVMYAGLIVEYGSVKKVFANPRHPYTQGLLACVPRLGQKHLLQSIPGSLPNLKDQHQGCLFLDRCPCVCPSCHNQKPQMRTIDEDHQIRCWRK
jgi:oligopeptide/dipeptide ABC transporter ATP-binding protein